MNKSTFDLMARAWMGIFLLTSASGCFYIPTWRFPTLPPCQTAEDAWGCAVDYVGNQSPVDQPWCDPEYQKQGVYRVAAYGISSYDSAGESYLNPESEDPMQDLGDLKPPMPESKGPMLPMPE